MSDKAKGPKTAELANAKLVTVGDRGVGKTSMLISYVKRVFPGIYVPILFEHYRADVTVGVSCVRLALCDTAEQVENGQSRLFSYPETDIFFICFSVENFESLENLEHQWIPEVRHYCPDTPAIVVACKIDLRQSLGGPMVTYEQGFKVASKFGMKYWETSSRTLQGLNECFEETVKSVLLNTSAANKKKGFFRFGKSKKPIPMPPVMPPRGVAPAIEIETSTFCEDWYKMLQNPRHADVTLVLEDKHRLQAHSVVLCSASKVFAKILGVANSFKNNQLKQISATEDYWREKINAGAVPGFAAIYDKDPGIKGQGCSDKVNTVIEMSADILAKSFVHVLEFLYSGVPHFTDKVDNIPEEEIRDLDRVASTLKLSQLKIICSNILTDQEFLNSSICTYVNDETRVRMKKLFFNKEEKSDVVFCVEGKLVFAHKCVLATRCQVMDAMFSGNFAESKSGGRTQINIPNTTLEVFLALLEYLYTDHTPIEDSDPVGIMVLSDEYCQKRLANLCELYITNEIDKSVTKRIEKAEIDVIGLLLTAQTHNANQLATWCLFFIASNYTTFEKRKEFVLLAGDNKDYVEKNRWPPLYYLEVLEEYEKKMAAETAGDSCRCSVM